MRIFLRSVWLLLMMPGLAFGQNDAHPTNSSMNNSDVATQLDALHQALSQTQQQLAAQQQEIQILKAQLKGGQSRSGATLIPAVAVVQPIQTLPNVNPSDPSPEIHNDIANPVSDQLISRRNRMNSNLRQGP